MLPTPPDGDDALSIRRGVIVWSLFTAVALVVTGERDEIAPVDQIEKCLPQWNPDARLEIIKGADHFYGGRIQELKSSLSQYPIQGKKMSP